MVSVSGYRFDEPRAAIGGLDDPGERAVGALVGGELDDLLFGESEVPRHLLDGASRDVAPHGRQIRSEGGHATRR